MTNVGEPAFLDQLRRPHLSQLVDEAQRVAVLAARRDLRAARHGITGPLRPLDSGRARHTGRVHGSFPSDNPRRQAHSACIPPSGPFRSPPASACRWSSTRHWSPTVRRFPQHATMPDPTPVMICQDRQGTSRATVAGPSNSRVSDGRLQRSGNAPRRCQKTSNVD